jgi:hypothetical protein
MFWNKLIRNEMTEISSLESRKIVSRIGVLYADLNDRSQLVKPRSSLPCTWFSARESFFVAYRTDYPQLSKELHDSYHHVYSELAFFIDDEDSTRFALSLDVAAKCRSERMQKLGLAEDESFCRKFIASPTIKIQSRKEIWDQLAAEKTCPGDHLLFLAETLCFCGTLYRAMYDEWVAYANFLAYQNKKGA